MDKPNAMPPSAHLLDDLESIRQLLGDADLQPPLLTDVEQAQIAAVLPQPPTVENAQARRQDTLLHLDAELRAAAQSIMQDVINDFTPHIETEIKRRLDARLERLLNRQE